MPILASFSRIATSSGEAGAYCKAKSRYLKKPVFARSVLIFGKSIAGAAGGAGCLRKADSGCAL
ncbi:hypothetical protein D3C78_1952610 [compost metagenome]